ncbi:MAG TPA: glycoside hydrolase family 17 [Gammaproteobacteria bacterium]|nr:glycoside hydrolase family 17 [Gammaproteobacteria bacterium]
MEYSSRKIVVLVVFGAAALLCVLRWWQLGRPVELPNAPEGRLACVSYTPAWQPEAPGAEITPAQIDVDLRRLANRFRCVRTYAVTRGMDAVPAVARKYGMKVLLGVWIGPDAADNEMQIRIATRLAGDNADVIKAIIVGNEVLLRHEQSEAALRGYLERVHAATHLPVSYADVWEFWLRRPGLAGAVSFITIHILPYWENNPVSVDAALDHTREVYAKTSRQFPGKHVLIGETGWPTAGRPRAGAVPSRINAARYIREFTRYAADHQLDYNLIEAYDQPWKRLAEGTVGGFWGLYDARGEAKYGLQGPVREVEDWQRGLQAALAAALLFMIAGAGIPPRAGRPAMILLATAGVITGATLTAQYDYLANDSRDAIEWLLSGAGTAWGWLAFLLILSAFKSWLDGRAALPRIASIGETIAVFRHGGQWSMSRMLGLLRFGLLAGMSYLNLGLVLDGRYRNFPITLLVLPVTSIALVEAIRARDTVSRARLAPEELLMVWWLPLAGLLLIAVERGLNCAAWSWAALCLLLAGGTCDWRRPEAGEQQRAQQQSQPGREVAVK